MEETTSTLDTAVAAALGTLGVVVRPKRCTEERSGKSVTRFWLGLGSVDPADGYRTREILNAWEAGTLPAAHPFLTILRAIENWRRLLDLSNKGVFCELAEVEGAPGIYQYVASSSGLRGIGKEALFKTGDLDFVAALGLVGLPVVAIDGPRHQRMFYVKNFTGARLGGLPPVDAQKAKKAWMADKAHASLPWSDPLAQGLRGLHNIARLRQIVKDHVPEVILLREGNLRATVRADAGDRGWERVGRHLSGRPRY